MASGTYDDFLAALRMRESGDNYQAQNQYGARGAYQFHEAALRSIGWYNDDGTNGSPDDWRGSFTAASGVSNIQQFLASRTSQDNAMKEWAKELWEYASSAQFRSTDYLGETIKGTVVTATGIIGGGHLWGPQAIDQYLDSGGSYDPKDPFGTPISEYVRLFSGYDSPFDSPSGDTPTNPNPTPTPTPTTGATIKVGAGSDTLVLKITQDAYQGDSQYSISVDGKQIGGTFTAKALHNSGQSDTLEIKGNWGVGNHTVSVQLLNDLYGGSADKDRNVYVESATYNGTAVNNSKLVAGWTKAQSFSITDSTAVGAQTSETNQPTTTTDTITVRVSGDSYNGDPNFVLTLDGRAIDTKNLVTADRDKGEWQTFTFTGDFDLDGLQNHRVGIKFDNDLWGGKSTMDRNLYIDKVTFNGTVNDTDATFLSNATKYWDFLV